MVNNVFFYAENFIRRLSRSLEFRPAKFKESSVRRPQIWILQDFFKRYFTARCTQIAQVAGPMLSRVT